MVTTRAGMLKRLRTTFNIASAGMTRVLKPRTKPISETSLATVVLPYSRTFLDVFRKNCSGIQALSYNRVSLTIHFAVTYPDELVVSPGHETSENRLDGHGSTAFCQQRLSLRPNNAYSCAHPGREQIESKTARGAAYFDRHAVNVSQCKTAGYIIRVCAP